MALTRQQKEQRVAELETNLKQAVSTVFASFNGLTVAEVNTLRDRLTEQGSRMRVMPKRLLKLVLQHLKVNFNPAPSGGQIAVVWGADAVLPAKAVNDFAKDHDNIKLIAGILEGELLSQVVVTNLANLPSRDQLLGQLVSVLSGPSRGLAVALSGVSRKLVYVLKAIEKQRSSQTT